MCSQKINKNINHIVEKILQIKFILKFQINYFIIKIYINIRLILIQLFDFINKPYKHFLFFTFYIYKMLKLNL
jgi:hypothetical protein